jgi:hypothetical protein
MLVEVTQQDINRGESVAWACPVARALQRVFPCEVEALYGELAWYFDDTVYTEIPSRRVQQFIERFDDGKPVQPFRFRVRAEHVIQPVEAPR